jgi:hypothetical protein
VDGTLEFLKGDPVTSAAVESMNAAKRASSAEISFGSAIGR